MGTLFGCILHSRPTVYFQSQPWKVLVVACGRAIHKIPPEYRIAFRGMSNVLDRYPQGAADEGFIERCLAAEESVAKCGAHGRWVESRLCARRPVVALTLPPRCVFYGFF